MRYLSQKFSFKNPRVAGVLNDIGVSFTKWYIEKIIGLNLINSYSRYSHNKNNSHPAASIYTDKLRRVKCLRLVI